MRAKQVRSPHRSFRLYLGYTWREEEEEEKERVDEDVGGREAEMVVARYGGGKRKKVGWVRE